MKQARIWLEAILLKMVSFPIISKFLRFLYSQPLSYFFIPLYCRLFEVDTSESEKPFWAYPSLRAYFCRRIRMDVRPFHKDPLTFTSPVDGVLIASGKISQGQLLQVKGKSYSLEALLDSKPMADSFFDGTYMTIYMSPGKYHHVHASSNGVWIDSKHVFGRRYPVNHFSRSRVDALYPRNERMISYFHTEHGNHCIVMVGSCQVGSVQKTTRDNSTGHQVREVNKGDEIGWFDFGSTVVLLWPKNKVELEKNKKIGDELKVGEPVATAIT